MRGFHRASNRYLCAGITVVHFYMQKPAERGTYDVGGVFIESERANYPRGAVVLPCPLALTGYVAAVHLVVGDEDVRLIEVSVNRVVCNRAARNAVESRTVYAAAPSQRVLVARRH